MGLSIFGNARFFALLLILASVASAFLLLGPLSPRHVQAQPFEPGRFVRRIITPSTPISPGDTITVRLEVGVDDEPATVDKDRFYLIDEVVPGSWPGDWELLDNGTLVDAGLKNASQQGHLKTVIFNDSGPVSDESYTYVMQVNSTPGTYVFRGTYQIEGMAAESPITGDSQVTIEITCLPEEICNNVDDNCVGGIDEGCDDDGDGYCDSTMDVETGTIINVCPNTDTTSAIVGDDCDDTRNGVYPGNVEIPCNGIDEDCDGFDECGSLFNISSNYYDGRTTQFHTIDARVPFGMVLEKTIYGMVVFKSAVDFGGRTGTLLIDSVTNISRHAVRVDSASIPELNKSANITLYNVTFTTPKIMRNSGVCPESICSFISYASDELRFSVNYFTTYSVEEGCGDGVIDPTENCDGSNVPATCQSRGFQEGTVTCTAECQYDFSGCYTPQPPPGPGPVPGPGPGSVPECVNGDTRSCGSSTGRCRVGYQLCTLGTWSSECFDETGPIDEICNGIDDDCDGEPDNGITCLCMIDETKECGLETGACVPGYRACIRGNWSDECFNDTGPTEEICDSGVDEDCDAVVDESDCVLSTSLICPEGEITEPCVCGDKVFTDGFCFGGVHSETDTRPVIPWEILALIGGIVLSVTLIYLVVSQVRKFKGIKQQIDTKQHKKASVKPHKGEHVNWVKDVTSSPASFINKQVKMGGYVKLSKKVSDKEYWYSFYDQMSTMAMHSTKPLKEGYIEMKVTLNKTPLGYLFAEAG